MSNMPRRGQVVEANRIRHPDPLSTGVEQENNNVNDMPSSEDKSGATVPEDAPTTTGQDDEKQQLEDKEPDKDWIVKFDGKDDPFDPKSMSTARKWLITMVVATSSLCV